MADDTFPCPPDEPVPDRQCWCCSFYGLLRPAFRDGRCVLCAIFPALCELGHGMAAKQQEAAGG